MTSYVLAHWRGRQGWLWTLLVNLLAARLVLTWLPDMPGAALLILFAVFSLCLLIWQVVGGWRAAELRMRAAGDLYSALALYAGVIVVSVLAITQAIDRMAGYFAVEQEIVAPEVSLLEMAEDGRVLIAGGPIDFALNTALRETLRVAPGAEVLRIGSEGGSIFAARALAQAVMEAGLNTQVTGNCFSACTIVFIAGSKRSLGPDGMLGFHGYAFDSAQRVQVLDVAEEEARDRAFFALRGVAAGFLDRAFATLPSDLWVPARAELLAAGVIGGVGE